MCRSWTLHNHPFSYHCLNVLWLVPRNYNETKMIGKSAAQNSQMPHHKIFVQLNYPKFHPNSTINVLHMNRNWFTFISKFFIPEFCITLDLTHFFTQPQPNAHKNVYQTLHFPRFCAIVGGPHQNITLWFYCISSHFSWDSCMLNDFSYWTPTPNFTKIWKTILSDTRSQMDGQTRSPHKVFFSFTSQGMPNSNESYLHTYAYVILAKWYKLVSLLN
jgi:hypothetical protein